MNDEQNEFLAKVAFALFATMTVLFTKVHAASPAFSLKQEKAISVILEKELHLNREFRDIKVTFFRCDEEQKKCLAVLKPEGRSNIFCELDRVEIADFKKSSFSILDPFYFNKIRSCLR